MSFYSENHFDLKLDQDYSFTDYAVPLLSQHYNPIFEFNISVDNDDPGVADINTKEKDNVKDIEKYHEYQKDTQDNIPWASSSDIRIVDTDKLPDPNPIVETEGCPQCGNIQAYWWIVQTDSGDEPSAQFFRCTKCNHTWRTPKSSL